MRPQHLRIHGLHSYSEPVEVDFEALASYGLFGIFGPIGAGKSTLLDALTLALYGQVDRLSSRARRGLLNPRCKQIEVRYRFELDGEVYEVERVYRHQKSTGAVQSHLARLQRLSPPVAVIADKEGEVTDAVTRLIGLTAGDFMRAVVLPQGKFMHFLHLKGTDRRMMLQRIFRLRAYGQGVREQVASRLGTVNSKLATHDGEVLGLGDASPEAVDAARVAVDQATQQQQASQAALDAARGSHAQLQVVRERRQRLDAVNAELAEHLQQHADIEALANQLQLAERARPVIGPARRWLTSRGVHDQAAAAYEQRVEAARSAEQRHRQAVERRESLRARHTVEAPALRAAVSRLEDANRRFDERREALRAIDHIQAQLTISRDKQTACESRRAEHASRRAEVKQQREALAIEYANVQVPAADREAVVRAVRAHDALQTAAAETAAADRGVTEARDRAEQAEQAEQAARKAHGDAQQALTNARAGRDAVPTVDAEALAAQAEQAARHTALADRIDAAQAERLRLTELSAAGAQGVLAHEEALGRAAHRFELARDEVARAEALQLQLARSRQAAVLAQTLIEGEACPVCGSPDHPAPERGDPEIDAAHQAAQQALDEARAAHHQASADHAAAKTRVEAARARLAELNASVAAAQAACDEVAEGRTAEQLRALAAELLERRQTAALSAEQRRVAEQAMQQAEVAVQATTRALASATAVRDSAAADLQARQAAHAQRKAEEGDAWAHFDAERGQFTFLELPGAQRALQDRDRRAGELYRKLQQADAELVTLEPALASLDSEAEKIGRELTKLEERLANARGACDKLTAQLGAWTDDYPPQPVLERTRAVLEVLVRQVDEAHGASERTQQAQAAAFAERAAAQATAESATEAVATARADLDEALAASGFDTHEQALAAALDAEQFAADQARVTAWTERRVALQERRDEAARTLGDDVLEPGAWEAAVIALSQAQAQASEASDQLGRARQALDDVQRRAERLAALQAQIGDLSVSQGRLETLSHLLRGNRFIEYVANDYLLELVREASTYLSRLSNGRYALVLDDGGAFVIRDADSGDALRPASSLSGGETFLTSLALALALSSQVRARGARPLEFFFLDEGFGSLDREALDRVMTALDDLVSAETGHRTIGLISHVSGVRERVPRYLNITPAGASGHGSRAAIVDN